MHVFQEFSLLVSLFQIILDTHLFTTKKFRERDFMRFGEIIKRARGGRFSQQSLGELIGVWGTYIGQIEKGERVPSDERCLLLAKALDLDTRKLLISAYQERTQSKEVKQLFSQMEKLLTDPVISQVLENKLLDPATAKALQSPGVRQALKNTSWREAIEAGSKMSDREIPELILLIGKMTSQQFQVLLTTAKTFLGET
jgi:transcriptional regulator with XRE-family HTH domain